MSFFPVEMSPDPRAGLLTCPNCGGAVAEGARRCGYCGVPLASLRCAACFHVNAPDAVHCGSCGRALGLEPVGTSDDSRCPRCAVPFAAFEGGSGKLRDCDNCGGQFIDHPLLRDLIQEHEVYGASLPRRERYRPQNPLSGPTQYVRCPDCGDFMHRKNFGGSSGVVVDICPRHGTWFDRGELPMVLAFVESGGLTEARRREIAELERQRRLTREAAAQLPPAQPLDYRSNGADLADWVTFVLELISRWRG